MITQIAVYDLLTGEIISTGGIQFDDDLKEVQIAAALAPWGVETCGLYEGMAEASKETQYVAVLDGVPALVDKPELLVFIENDKTTILADGVDETTLTGLPDPCEIIIDDPDPTVETQVVEVTGGGFVFTAEDPGVYSIEVVRFPFLPWIVEITAT